MKKYLSLQILVFISIAASAQTDSFDVYYYQPPEFFIIKHQPAQIQFSLENNDTSFCTLLIHKSSPAKRTVLLDVNAQWKDWVVNKLAKADKKPVTLYTEQMWDGWASTVAVGNFYLKKKKCVVMLNSFRKDKKTACVVYLLSDKTYKPVIDSFSKSLHLKQ